MNRAAARTPSKRMRKLPPTARGSASASKMRPAASDGASVSAWRNHSTSPRAAQAPACICVPRPRSHLMTRAPRPSATSAVPSALPPSTTMTSTSPPTRRAASSVAPMERASSSAGMMTESRGASLLNLDKEFTWMNRIRRI
jgi:hypothetical protein